MRLTLHTDYSLRVLIYLGLRGERLSTINEIAEGYGISKNHLMKVVQALGQLGYVETIRGRGGGLRLGVDPEKLRLGEVVRRLEGDMELVQCFGSAEPRCRIERCCGLRGALDEALLAFLRTLDRYTLADVLGPRLRLARMLGLPAPAAAE
jgi:Rrf2 family nitric oxide-sensitive transcriptional repressor